MAGLWLPVSVSGELVTGTYRFTFRNPGIQTIPFLQVPKSYDVFGKVFTITRSYADEKTGKYIVEFRLKENPVAVSTIVFAVVIVLGVTVGYLTLEKVEKLVENPGVTIGLVVIAGVVAVALIRNVRKGGL